MTLTTPEEVPPETAGPVRLDGSGGGRSRFGRITQETGFLKGVTGAAAVVPLVALGCILGVLFVKAWPAVRVNGVGFLGSSKWVPGNQYATPVTKDGILVPPGATYGALPLVLGTLATSFIAILFAVPVSVGAALAVVEKLPQRASNAVGMFLEVLAGIPSVIFGLWGALTFGPILARDVSPILADIMPKNVPVLDFFAGPTGYGEGLLSAGLVLGMMIIPIVAATTRDLLRSVPRLPKEGALAMGMTDFEVARKVSLPWIKAGIIGASVLGLARALGETIAVAMVSSAATGALPQNLYLPMTTIAATIVSQLDSALSNGTGSYAVRTLAEFALVLAVITLLTNVAARVLVRRVAGTALPVGRGL